MKRLRTGVLLLPLLALLISLPALAAEGDLIRIDAKSSAAETLENLKKLVEQKGFTIFATYDHGDKESVKQVIAFGKPKQNARILWHDPAAGLELPFRMAVIQYRSGATEVLYNKPTSLRNTYRVGKCRLLDELDGVMAELAQQAAQ